MVQQQFPKLMSGGMELDPNKCGLLRDSSDAIGDAPTLQKRMAEEGYLYVPGFYNRDDVQAARMEILQMLADEGALDADAPLEDGIANPEAKFAFRPDLAKASAKLQSVIYSSRLLGFYEALLGGEVRHYDYTWLRAVTPGRGTSPHCDIVYMGRGTTRLYTAWTPLGDISYEMGGLVILENSCQITTLQETYGRLDVDKVCSNRERGANELEAKGYVWTGAITNDPLSLQAQFGGRWLTSEFRMGDLLTFGMFTVHGSLDNQSKGIRLSSDSRYQLASDPVDERWVGEEPIGHGAEAKQGLIC